MQSLEWPPNFSVKKHTRARHVKLKISEHKGLEIVVPPRFNQKEILPVLAKHRTWIEKQLLHIQKKQQAFDAIALPHEIHFPMFNHTWRVDYVANNNHQLRILSRPHQEIVLFGAIQDKKACFTLLRKWVKLQAKHYLPLSLEGLSQQCNLPFSGATVRDQTSRWGSCSEDKKISLNYKIILLPLELAFYVVVHELCHTVHMNHSDKFWKLVARFDPDWKTHRAALRRPEECLPKWAIATI